MPKPLVYMLRPCISCHVPIHHLILCQPFCYIASLCCVFLSVTRGFLSRIPRSKPYNHPRCCGWPVGAFSSIAASMFMWDSNASSTQGKSFIPFCLDPCAESHCAANALIDPPPGPFRNAHYAPHQNKPRFPHRIDAVQAATIPLSVHPTYRSQLPPQ